MSAGKLVLSVKGKGFRHDHAVHIADPWLPLPFPKWSQPSWIVPAYTCSHGAESLAIMRVVVKENFSYVCLQ